MTGFLFLLARTVEPAEEKCCQTIAALCSPKEDLFPTAASALPPNLVARYSTPTFLSRSRLFSKQIQVRFLPIYCATLYMYFLGACIHADQPSEQDNSIQSSKTWGPVNFSPTKCIPMKYTASGDNMLTISKVKIF